MGRAARCAVGQPEDKRTVTAVATSRRRLHARNQGQGRPRSRFYQIAHRIAARMEPRAARSFLAAVRQLQRSIDIDALERAIRAGSTADGVAAAIGDLGVVLAGTDIERNLRLTATLAGQAGAEVLTGVTGLRARFNALHPNVVLFAREQAGALIVALSAEQLETVRIVLALGQVHGLTYAEQARALREVVGLPPNWARAPLNLAQELREGRFTESRRLSAIDKQQIRSRLKNGTIDEPFIQKMQARYAQSLTNRRALNIARTETLRAANHGQREEWLQARDQGVLPSTVRRVWIVTPDDRLRETHAAIPFMNQAGVPLDQPYMTPLGPSMGPPLETNCRCSEGLIFPDLRAQPPEQEQELSVRERKRQRQGGASSVMPNRLQPVSESPVWQHLPEVDREILSRRGLEIAPEPNAPFFGAYEDANRIIRLASDADYSVLAHEIGHAVDFAMGAARPDPAILGANPISGRSFLSRPIRRELQRDGGRRLARYRAHLEASYDRTSIRREVFADIYAVRRAGASSVRAGMFTADDIESFFPETIKAFDQLFSEWSAAL